MSTRFLTTPNTPESGRMSPTASSIEGALEVNQDPTFVSRSRRLFEEVNAAKVIPQPWEVVDVVKFTTFAGVEALGGIEPLKRPPTRPPSMWTTQRSQQRQGFPSVLCRPLRATKVIPCILTDVGIFHSRLPVSH